MSIVAKVLRVTAAVLNAAADFHERNPYGTRPPFDARAARDAQRFDQQLTRQAERSRRVNLLIALSQRAGEAGNRRAWRSLRAIDPCSRCGTQAGACDCP